jgi:uncharacterized damage-inducible protein DinB
MERRGGEGARPPAEQSGGCMKRLFDMMAEYNSWANRRLYDACAALDSEERRAGLGAFFGSLHGTLNHLLVADRIWMARFEGAPAPEDPLDAELYEKFVELRSAREAEDARIVSHVAGLREAQIVEPIGYARVTGPERITQPRWAALQHFFNHQTHHRGQCHAMLTRIAMEAPSFDLIDFQRETGRGLG